MTDLANNIKQAVAENHVKDGIFPRKFLEDRALAFYQGYGVGITLPPGGSFFSTIITDSGQDLYISRDGIDGGIAESDWTYNIRPILGKLKLKVTDSIRETKFWKKYKVPDPTYYQDCGVDASEVRKAVYMDDGTDVVYIYLGDKVQEAAYLKRREQEIKVSEGFYEYEEYAKLLLGFVREATVKRAKQETPELRLLNELFKGESSTRFKDSNGLVYDTKRSELIAEGWFNRDYCFMYRKRTGKMFLVVQPRFWGDFKLKVLSDAEAGEVAIKMLNLCNMKPEVYENYFGTEANIRVKLNTTVFKSLRDRASKSRKTIAQLLELGLKADGVLMGLDFAVEDVKADDGDTTHEAADRVLMSIKDPEFDGILDSQDLATVIALIQDWKIFMEMMPDPNTSEYMAWLNNFERAKNFVTKEP